MVGSVLHYIFIGHVSSNCALGGYTVSIISFIKNSLAPISEHFYFFIVILKSICSCTYHDIVKWLFGKFL